MKKILFLTGTRADYGKIKSLIKKVELSNKLEAYVFVCGMHLIETFGFTYNEVLKDNYTNVYVAYGIEHAGDMAIDTSNVISHLTGYIKKIKPDMIVVHGDRTDALAGALVGVLNNIIVAHIEGGEISGTIDESIRHAVSKLAHIHFVSNEDAKRRLLQMGESPEKIFVIGSPDIDIMLSNNLPSLINVKKYYDIEFDNYAIFMYHPVTTKYETISENIKIVLSAILRSSKNYVVIYPNNDLGSEFIINEINKLRNNTKFRIFESIRFEYFLTLLKNADFMIGNSSAGIRETCVYGIPAIDIGTRQQGRYTSKMKNIKHVNENIEEICLAIDGINIFKIKNFTFGFGNSTELFIDALEGVDLWNIDIQKRFIDKDIY